MTRRLSVKRTFLNNVMQQVEQHGETHAKVGFWLVSTSLPSCFPDDTNNLQVFQPMLGTY